MRYFSKSLGLIVALAMIGSIPMSAMAQADGDSPWLIRVRALWLVLDDSSSTITTIGGNAEVDDSTTVELDISYFLTDNVALELILAVSQNDVNAVNTSVGNADLGDVSLLPPTLTLQYHLMPDGIIRPYIGAGINATHFFNEDSGDTATGISYDDSLGIAVQAGLDYGINDDWALNIDVKKLFLSTDVDVQALGTTVSTKVDLDPWLFGLGLARRF